MKWDKVLRVFGILGMVLTFYIYSLDGISFQVYAFTIISIGTLVMPEFVDQLPVGPTK